MSIKGSTKQVPIEELSTFEGRCRHLYVIQTKEGQNKNFKFLQAQKEFNQIVEQEFERTKQELGAAQCRIIALKPRQVGWTTYSNVKSLDMQIQDEGSNGVIVAHDTDTTEKIYRIYQRAYDNLPDYVIPTKGGRPMTVGEFISYTKGEDTLQSMLDAPPKEGGITPKQARQTQHIPYKPEHEAYSGKRIGFKDTDSMTTIFTAGKGDAGGLGGTVRRIHMCLHEDSRVILSDGSSKKIKDIQVGDSVLASDGTVCGVSAKIDTGEKQTYSLRTWLSDQDIKLSKEHKVLTDSGWKRTKDLSEDDLVALPDIQFTNEITEYSYDLNDREDKRWTTTTGTIKHTFDLDYDFGYLLGYYLAEGHIKYEKNKDTFSQISFACHEDEIYYEKVVEDFGDLATSVSVDNRKGKRKVVHFYGVFLPNVINDICGRTTDKHIPEWVFKTNKEFAEGIVVGYLAGDGSKTANVWKREYGGYKKWTPKNPGEKIYNYLNEYYETKKAHKSIRELDEEYGFSESTGVRYNKLFKGKSLEDVKEGLDWNLNDTTPEQVYNYLQERKEVVRYPVKHLNEKYGITATTSYDWRKAYSGKSVEYIKNNHGGRQANSKDEYTYNYITATSICERITRQLRRIILGLDVGVASVGYVGDRYRYDIKTKPIYLLKLHGQVAKYFSDKIEGCESSGCLNNRSNKYKKIDGRWFVKIKNLERAEVSQTYDIEVDNATHDFETPVGIVSNSECANYHRYKDLMTSLKPSVPKFADNVFFILESTANGTTGDGEGFYKAWERATKEWEKYKKGELRRYTGLRPVFIPWYMIKEYELPLAGGKFESIDSVDFGSPEAKQKFLQREQRLMEEGIWNPLTESRQVLTPEKINWYRFIIKEDCEHDFREAQRFYPTTPEEAFVASSNCFFNAEQLNEVKRAYMNEGEPEYDLGELQWQSGGTIDFEASKTGNFKVWSHPEHQWDHRYVVALDIGRGYEDGDYSIALVFDRLEQEFVAKWHGRIDQDKFAEVASQIGIYYNEALLVPESNLDTVIELIKPDGHRPYLGELYYRDNSGRNMKWGYWTSGGNRNVLINQYKAWLRDNEDGYWSIKDLSLADEHLTFVRHQTNTGVKYEASEGNYDDQVIGSALAIEGDMWWERAPEKYEPNKVMEVLSRVTNRKTLKQSKLGRN